MELIVFIRKQSGHYFASGRLPSPLQTDLFPLNQEFQVEAQEFQVEALAVQVAAEARGLQAVENSRDVGNARS